MNQQGPSPEQSGGLPNAGGAHPSGATAGSSEAAVGAGAPIEPTAVSVLTSAEAILSGTASPTATPSAEPQRRRRLHRPRLSAPHLLGAGLPRRVRTLDSFSSPNYRLLWLSTLGIGGAGWIVDIVVGWLTYDLTRSPLLTGIALGLGALPFLLAGPFAGVIADSWDRRKLMMGAVIYLAVVMAAFTAVVLSGIVATWMIFSFVFIYGFAYIVLHTATMPMITAVVPRENLVNAFALNALAFNGARLIVPALAGTSIALFGPGITLVFAVAIYAAAFIAVRAIRIDAVDVSDEQRKPSLGKIVEGARYIKSDPIVLGIFVMGILPLFFIAPVVNGLMPVYAAEIFHVGPAGLGLLVSSLGAGATVGAIVIASLGSVRNKGRVLYVAIIIGALGMVALSRAGSIYVAIPMLAIVAATMATFFSVSTAIMQGNVPDSMRGRVAALSGMPLGLFPLGGALAGGIAESIGAPGATLVSAGLLAILLGVFAITFRSIWAVE